MRVEIKKAIRESRDDFSHSLEGDHKNNPKRFWSILKFTSKSHNIPDVISTAKPGAFPEQDTGTSRITADKPIAIANLFNRFFTSLFANDSPSEATTCELEDEAVMTNLTLYTGTAE